MFDVIILGGGPAGVAAAVYASRKLLKTLLITRDFGGQSVNSASIENFVGWKSISGLDFARLLEEHVKGQPNLEIKEGTTVVRVEEKGGGFEVTDSSGGIFTGKNIFIALGSEYRKLGVPGEKEYEGKGVFYCSICDAPLMKNKAVAVIGAGNSGLEAAEDLLPYASRIYLLSRSGAIKGDPITYEKIKKDSKVETVLWAQTKEIVGKNGFVSALRFQNLQSREDREFAVSGVFVEVGRKPNTEIFSGLVNLNGRGQIVVDHKTMQTSHPRIWAAGDITDGSYNQINTAMGDAIKAALHIYESVKKSS